MKNNIGPTLQEIRLSKGLKAKEICKGIIPPQRMSEIENGVRAPYSDVFILLLSKLNTTFDEFLLHLDNEYLQKKATTRRQIAESINLRNIEELRRQSEEYGDLYTQYGDDFFNHAKHISLSLAELIHTKNNFTKAREHLKPVINYLKKVNLVGDYEIFLVKNLLFIFDVSEVEGFVKDALDVIINENSTLYQEESSKTVLYTNLAIYYLDYPEYYRKAIHYSNEAITSSIIANNATDTIHAKIINQIARFKHNKGDFNKDYLEQLVDVFKLLEYHSEYKHCIDFIEKQGIKL